jgi:hypothetical protein
MKSAPITLEALLPDIEGWSAWTALQGGCGSADTPKALLSIVDEKSL